MLNIADPVTQWASVILVSVVVGTLLLIAVAIFRRWTQNRYARYVHSLQRQYRPVVAKVLSGAAGPAGMEALRELPLAEIELLLDPLFSKRKLPERCLVFLRALCVELGMIQLWQCRLANGYWPASQAKGSRAHKGLPNHAVMRYLLRAKSIRNLGTLHHRPSWPLLVRALDDRHPDIQLVALRSLAALGSPESFPVLRERLHALVEGKTNSPPLQALQAAMVSFDLTCAPALLPSLRHPNRQIRLHGTEILRTMVCREAARQPGLVLTAELLTSPMVERLLSGLAADNCSEIRARTAEVMVFLGDPRAKPVLRNLLLDHQWFVRLRTVRALAHMHPAATPLYAEICQCLRDPHWRVREAAIQTLISLGPGGKHQLYEHFLTSPDRTLREQIVGVIERAGLMAALVEEYSEGTDGAVALMIEQLASEAAPMGLAGVLRALNPEIRRKFLDRFSPEGQSELWHPQNRGQEPESANRLKQIRELPPYQAA
jgi:HEAT repeat protein